MGWRKVGKIVAASECAGHDVIGNGRVARIIEGFAAQMARDSGRPHLRRVPGVAA
jgi:hypothetical protein